MNPPNPSLFNPLRRLAVGAVASVALAACGGLEVDPEVTASAATSGGSYWTGAGFTYAPPACRKGSFSCGGREDKISKDLAKTCTDARWVGYQLGRRPTRCLGQQRWSRRGYWTARKLFTAPQHSHVALPSELERFCVYEWTPRRGTNYAPDIGVLPDVASMRLERDCEAVAPLFTPGPSANMVRDSYLAQVGVPQFPSRTYVDGFRVDVAVVDTAPDLDIGNPSADGHALGVGAIISEVSAVRRGASVTPRANILSYQGMPLGSPSSYGRPTDVADGISRAVNDWLGGGASAPLVVNLSLGWDARYGAEHGPSMRVTALAAYIAIQRASCAGALVIAASGNRSAFDGAGGTTYPGGWQAEERLCDSHMLNYHPLVVSVGPLDPSDTPPLIAREGSLPRLLAPGTFAAGELDGLQGRLLTGSSVSAAAASGAAALAWSVDRAATADMVVSRHLYGRGVNLPGNAYVTFPAEHSDLVRLDVCAAAQNACLVSGTGCPLACTTRPAQHAVPPPFEQIFEAEFPGVLAFKTAATLAPGAARGADEMVVHPNAVVPQPQGMTCSVCFVLDDSILAGQLEVEPAVVVEGLFLRYIVCDPAGECSKAEDGISIELPDWEDEFVVEIGPQLGLKDGEYVKSAMLETLVSMDGEEGIYGSELFIE